MFWVGNGLLHLRAAQWRRAQLHRSLLRSRPTPRTAQRRRIHLDRATSALGSRMVQSPPTPRRRPPPRKSAQGPEGRRRSCYPPPRLRLIIPRPRDRWFKSSPCTQLKRLPLLGRRFVLSRKWITSPTCCAMASAAATSESPPIPSDASRNTTPASPPGPRDIVPGPLNGPVAPQLDFAERRDPGDRETIPLSAQPRA